MEANINGHRCKLRAVKRLSNGYWRFHIRTSQLNLFDYLILHTKKPTKHFFVVPVADIPREYFERKDLLINISPRASQALDFRARFHWWSYHEKWDLLLRTEGPLAKKKMAKVNLPVAADAQPQQVV
ncbi:MAG: hypothetical protein AAB638_00955 [Patescibacteria group bacterium]